MFRGFTISALATGLLLAGCATTPDPYDPFDPRANTVAPPHVYGGDPLSRSEFQNMTAAPRPEVPASYNQPSPPASPTAAPEAYQGQQPYPRPTVSGAQPAAYEATATETTGSTNETSPTPQTDALPRIAEKPETAPAAMADPIGDAGRTEELTPYGHAADYTWLRGKLQYSHVERAWKLRYAPIDVENDPHGGGVFLGNDPRLQDFQEGDVVYVEGRTLAGPTGAFSPGPRYQIDTITQLEKP